MSNDLCTKVPDNLKRLLRYVLKSFYSFELYLVMEMLIIYPCIKEEDLAELLKLDQKIVRQYLINLKQEKFISEKSTIETSADAKQQKKTYYYVNYKSMVNVIKYKLDKIRLQIELEEKQCTSRASFKCTQCLKTYSDLDMNEMLLLTMRCTHCGGLVDEDSSNIQNRAARNLLAKFNTQMELIYRLLHEVENIKLAPNILSPAPTDYSELIQSLNTSPNAPTGGSSDTQKKSNNNATKGHTIWSGEASRFVQIQTKTEINFIEASVATIDVNSTMGETNNAFDENSQDFRYEEIKANNALSSIIDSKVRSKTQTSSILKSDQFLTKQETIDDNPEKKNLDENILKLLLIHENKNKNDLINRQASLSSGGGSVVGGSTLKKRDSNHLNNDIEQLMSHGFGIVDNNHVNPKKRRLNGYYSEMDIENTNIYHQTNGHTEYLKSHHTKVDFHLYDQNSMDIDDNSLYSLSNHTSNTTTSAHLRYNSIDSNNNNNDYDELIVNENDEDYFSIKIGNKLFTIDKITTDLIAKMTRQEKDIYVEKCRHLYTAMYELDF